MNLVVGLGNPGARYRESRHNLGFRVVEELARQEGWQFETSTWWQSARGNRAAEDVVLTQPLTFMNDSGRAVRRLMGELGIELEKLMVVCDDLNLEPGRIRLRRRGSSGGHKGLASVAEALGTEDFARLRLGIGAPRGDAVEFVLSEFPRAERAVAEEAILRAAEAVRCWADQGVEEAMNLFNRPSAQPQGGTCETV